jgi:hypothetical protein
MRLIIEIVAAALLVCCISASSAALTAVGDVRVVLRFIVVPANAGTHTPCPIV